MLTFLSTYAMFLAKSATIVIAIMAVVGFIAAVSSKGKSKEKLVIKKINDKYQKMKELLNHTILNKKELKQLAKQQKKSAKAIKKSPDKTSKKRMFVVKFKGDIKAAGVNNFRETITAILNVATPNDEIVACIESPGGVVHGYGLAASQLQRIRERNIPLTACVDKIAASGGYLMASVANQILAAPFAIVGSIGVIAQIPNFNKLLKKHNIDFEQITSGEYKRTLSMFGENNTKGRKKMQQEVEEAHELFKNFVLTNRPALNLEKVATGEHWFGQKALELGLVDKLTTSDDYLLTASETADIYEVSYSTKKKFAEKISHSVKTSIENIWPFT